MFRNGRARSEGAKAARFGLVGAAATLMHLVAAQAVLATGVAPVAANAAGFAAAFGLGLLGHYHFTFRAAGPFARALRRYGVIAIGGFLVNNLALAALVASGRVGDGVALATAILLVPAATFLASRLWGFAAPRPPDTRS